MMKNNTLITYKDIQSRSNILVMAPLRSYKRLSVVATLSALLLIGCDSNKEYHQNYSESAAESVDYTVTEEAVQSDMDDMSDSTGVTQLSDNTEAQLGSQALSIEIEGKTLLITANANFIVEDVIASVNTIENLTRQYKGYIESSTINNNEHNRQQYRQGDNNIALVTYQSQARMLVRIPKEQVSDFLKQVQKQVIFLNNQQFEAKDVTLDLYREQLEQQLNADKAAELEQQRLKATNEKTQASNVDTINATYETRRQQQYAKLQEMQINDRVKYSTIELGFTQPEKVYKEVTQSIDALIESDVPSFSEQVQESLIIGWNNIKQVVLWFISTWWFWVLLGLLYLLYLAVRQSLLKVLKSTSILKHNRQGKPLNDEVKKAEEKDTDV